MKVFLSQPMKGRTKDEILEDRGKYIKLIKEYLDEDVEILDSYFDDGGHVINPLGYLGRSLTVLAQADIAFFIRGWEYFRGCRIEHLSCQEYGIETRYIE